MLTRTKIERRAPYAIVATSCLVVALLATRTISTLFVLADQANETTLIDANKQAFIVPSTTASAEWLIVAESTEWPLQLASAADRGDFKVASIPAFEAIGRATSARFASWPTDDWVVGYRGDQRTVLCFPGQRHLDEWGNAFFEEQGWQRLEIGEARGEAVTTNPI